MHDAPWENVCTHVNTCSLTGAAAFFAGIPESVVVVNGQLWCYFYAQRYLEKQSRDFGERILCTQADENTVVYGTEEWLVDTLRQVHRNYQPSVVCVINSCAVSLIGDDAAGIASQVPFQCPVVCLDSSGLHGGFWEGYQAAAMAYFKVLPLENRSFVQPSTVNLLGCTVGYYNAENDLAELLRLLETAGYRVQACPGAGSSIQDIAAMAKAELNIVVHEELGGQLAQFFEQQYGIPYVSMLPPYGLTGTLDWVKAIAQHTAVTPGGWEMLEKQAQKAGREIRHRVLEMERIWGHLWFEKIVVAGPSSVALSVSQAVRSELADAKCLSAIIHDDVDTQQIAADAVDIVLHGSDSGTLEQGLKGLSGGLLLGSSNETYWLHRHDVSNVVSQNIALPVYDEVVLRGRPFMGVYGMRNLTSVLWNKYIAEKEKV